ncbi:helix-turn-helix domain-containing protein [Escherichia coli]|nr:helix-turn-helix domain-containing protein [Escherichia coli]MDN2189650.1 helix-turn-helix domain-containing protein [Escherichia coli]
MSIKNDGHYFCRAGGNRPDGLNEPVTSVRAIALEQLGLSHSTVHNIFQRFNASGM